MTPPSVKRLQQQELQPAPSSSDETVSGAGATCFLYPMFCAEWQAKCLALADLLSGDFAQPPRRSHFQAGESA